jgi:hypothetical protein
METGTQVEPLLVPLPDAAAMLGIDVRTLRLAIERKQIAAIEIGRRTLVLRTALTKLANAE